MKHLSATSIWTFKTCPTRYRLRYVEHLKEAVEHEARRFGTNWHRIMEILGEGGTLEDVVNEMGELYGVVPEGMNADAWAIEYQILVNATAGYLWYWQNVDDPWESIGAEQEFDLPLVNPETNRPTPNFIRVGRMDDVVQHRTTGMRRLKEYKTTSRPIDSDSTYWKRLRMDTQSKFYLIAAQDLGLNVCGLWHDVFRKPTIRPKKLTMAESATFVETGEYCGRTFNVQTDGHDESFAVTVNDVRANLEFGKGTFQKFAIRETPEMFGARFLQDITERPENYFARREVNFTTDELVNFRGQVWNIQKNISEMDRSGTWFENENQCEATGNAACPYLAICYNNVQCCDGTTTPTGFVRKEPEA